MGDMELYSEDFHKAYVEGSRQSAKVIVPLVVELLKPITVVDVGCSLGSWLSVFQEYGIEDFLGIDGAHLDERILEIPKEKFLQFDLRRPLHLDRQFDLAVSLEVAEHLPAESADLFVGSLTRLSPAVLFSAAIPFQGGMHLNEQWPGYWASKFEQRGYAVIDCIRRRIWQNDNVKRWYAQNMLLFVRNDHLKNHPQLEQELERTFISQLSIVHPKSFLAAVSWADPKNMSLRRVLSALPILVKNALVRKLR